ncbi:DUF1028 domain-containing protein [Glutamicibacter sp.]|uniref:DUF1028 domain-containing protein n=1 Tax=Glutamicibacter sp. TaxID=1931995 RepID=UPI003D6B25E5
MTFSVIGTDGNGRFGLAVSSSSPAVAARCTHLRDDVGAVSSQNITDPRLGPRILDLMQDGASAQQALDTALEGYRYAPFRQITVLDASGGSALFQGEQTLGIHGGYAQENCVAAGNMLASGQVPQAVARGFTAAEGQLEERLLAALQAGVAAGGEAGPVHSAGLAVVSGHGWRDTDLRVDWHDNPVAELERLLGVWLPQREDYVQRALEPAASAGYGVPGDER